MAKRKQRADPDSSDDEIPHHGQVTLSKEAKKAVRKQARRPKEEGGPFHQHSRPSEAETRAARDSLALLHGEPQRANFDTDSTAKAKRSIMDSLVQTILSQNTTDSNSHKTFANLKADFKNWEEVRTAPSAKVEASIKMGGLAAIKTGRIKEILDSTVADVGECSLEHLRERSDDDIKEELLKFKGVGPKTAACVLMFSLGRFEFPVDTHVWRITKSLGWVPGKASREETYEHLNTRIPDDIKYDLHVLLVEHGKRCPRCSKTGHPRKEVHGPCPLVNLASAAKAGHRLSATDAAEEATGQLRVKGQPQAIMKGGGKGKMAGSGPEVKEEVKPKIEELRGGIHAELGPVQFEEGDAVTMVKPEPVSAENVVMGQVVRRSRRAVKTDNP